MRLKPSGSGRGTSNTDWLVRLQGVADPEELSALNYAVIEFEGTWQFLLHRGQNLETVLQSLDTIDDVVPCTQQANGDAVLEEAPLLILTNYGCTIFIRRADVVQDEALLASPPVWWDDEDVPPRICWLYALQLAQELEHLKHQLPALLVPPAGPRAKEKRGYLAADASDLTSLTATSPQSSRGTLVQDAASSSTGTLPELSLATAGLTKELLGMGASSIVMLGHDDDGKELAVKQYRRKAPNWAAQFETEKRACEALKGCPAVPPFRGAGILANAGVYVFVTDMVGVPVADHSVFSSAQKTSA